jgi:glutamate decarboxylase
MKRSVDPRNGLMPAYTRPGFAVGAPKDKIPQDEMLPDTAYNLIHDELIIDGNSRFNLATFVTTWMEPAARQLIGETLDKNMIDKDEYPQTAELETRCWRMLADLWHAPDPSNTIGTSTTGSSEACMLGGLAAKWRWRRRRKALGKPADKPNIVMGTDVQVVWEKFARYFDVAPKYIPMEGNRFIIDGETVARAVDENTIAVIAIMGATFTGQYENVEEISKALDDVQTRTGLDIDIHVDGASGGFIAPFIQPDLVWDFRLPRVKSINTSGHKYGLVYPGVGWVVWRERTDLPDELIFNVNYLGGEMPTFALNFSRPGNQIIAQYYNFIRYGRDGYRRIQQYNQDVARYLSGEIAKLGPFELLTDGSDIPVFAWKMKAPRHWTLYDLAERLRDRGWLVPAYSMPPNRQDLVVQRVVVKYGFTRDLADLLLDDMRRHIAYFESQPGLRPKTAGTQFHH